MSQPSDDLIWVLRVNTGSLSLSLSLSLSALMYCTRRSGRGKSYIDSNDTFGKKKKKGTRDIANVG